MSLAFFIPGLPDEFGVAFCGYARCQLTICASFRALNFTKFDKPECSYFLFPL